MRRNYFEEPEDRAKRIAYRNPFDDNQFLTLMLYCSDCKIALLPFPITLNAKEEMYATNDAAKRMHSIIQEKTHMHKCNGIQDRIKIQRIEIATVAAPRLCSGYGVFPDRLKCPGCEDCRVNNSLASFQSGSKIETEEDEDKIQIGTFVINTKTGHVWRIDTKEDMQTILGGMLNGQTHIKKYL